MNIPKLPDLPTPDMPDLTSIAEKVDGQVNEMVSHTADKLNQIGDQVFEDTEALKERLVNMTPDEQAVLETLLGR